MSAVWLLCGRAAALLEWSDNSVVGVRDEMDHCLSDDTLAGICFMISSMSAEKGGAVPKDDRPLLWQPLDGLSVGPISDVIDGRFEWLQGLFHRGGDHGATAIVLREYFLIPGISMHDNCTSVSESSYEKLQICRPHTWRRRRFHQVPVIRTLNYFSPRCPKFSVMCGVLTQRSRI